MLSVQRVGNIGARNMISVGAQIGNGLARGMIAALPAVTSAANALVLQAERAARAAADIHSPSRLFRDNVGIYIGQGIAVGIDRSQKYVNEALENLYDVKGKFDYSDLLDDGLKQHGYTANLNGSLTLESKQSDQKLDIIKDALNTIKQSLDREVVLNVNGQEFARLTGDDFSRYQSDRDYISNILKGVRV
jgi:tail protein